MRPGAVWWRVAIGVIMLVARPGGASGQELTVRLVGNAGVQLSDGDTALLVDLPYEPGAFGYMRYEPGQLRPAGATVSVITHHHRDHFDPGLFLARAAWRVIGPPSVTAGLPRERVMPGDSVVIDVFSIVALPTPHTDDHRSYRVRWRGRVLHFTGDTESAASVPATPRLDVLFVTPWLQCALVAAGRAATWERAVVYHRQPDGSDRVCGAAETPAQGAQFALLPR